MTARLTARVKWFNPRTGYGFLTDTTSSDDIFVHHSQITTSNNVYKTLTQGEYVEYDTTSDDSGKSLASNVTGLNKGPLLCERPQSTFRRQTRGGYRGGRGRARGGERRDTRGRQTEGEKATETAE
tara:strand:- start:160 stop:537 length:378 start_codon:yes stop_codon:yes gene_type:complete